ncbi:hypothetical protein L914_02020 [Phytophthora nicotianae]|uniref:Uncharacterized protein n=1 Tax=Phytophthora nicotianae TaxID=4792 RepID=W2P125_PHYNI|nr:hypothetical protein L914_02020 [Phytophthora nicotianae]
MGMSRSYVMEITTEVKRFLPQGTFMPEWLGQLTGP